MDAMDKIGGFFSSLGFKLALIAFLSLILLIPAAMIRELIREREQRRSETVTEVTSIWGNAQTLSGPVLTVPVDITLKSEKDQNLTIRKNIHYLPEKLMIEGTVVPEVRHRGIYRVVTYTAKLHVSGTFNAVTLESLQQSKATIADKASIEIGIPDMRGINKEIAIKWNDETVQVIPGVKTTDIAQSGVHAPVNFEAGQSYRFDFDLDLNGSHSLSFIPLGKETEVKLSSSWNSPSFTGAFIPDDRKLNANGFTATWNVLQLNRNFPQQWTNDEYSVTGSAFGVELITPADNYQKSDRSAKYAILFIGLTFLVFFFAEVMTKTRIHAFSYLLTGFAIVVFYSLLTALAEHLKFNVAYLISSLTIIAMIAAFAKSLYRKWQVTLTVVTCLVALYVFLFVILQLADYSLLLGNIGLVIILAIVMYFSRKIDWYSPHNA